MASLGDVFLRLRSDDSQYKNEVVKQGAAAGDKAGQAAGDSMGRRIGSTLKKHSTLIATSAGAALGTFAATSAQEFAKFEQSMNEVFTLMPNESQETFDKMESQVKQFSMEFGKMPDEVVPALYQSLSAGVDKDNVFAFLETANKLAVGGVAETSEAVGVLATVTKGYGDTSEEATQAVSDMLFTTVKLGTTTIPELAASMGKAVPQAAALGVAQEELFAITAALTGVTGNTSEVMTQQKAIMTSLLNPTAQMKKGLAELGYESGGALVEAEGLSGALEMLEESTNGDTEAFAKMLGSSEALTAGLAIVGSRADAVETNMEEMRDATGATEKAFSTMDSGVAAAANRIKAKLKVLALNVGEAIAPIGPLLTAFGPMIGKALGGAFGAGFGWLATQIPRLMAPVLTKMGAVMAASNMGTHLASSMVSPKSITNIMASGTRAGAVFGAAFKLGLIAIVAVVWLEVWNQWNALMDKIAAEKDRLKQETDEAIGLGADATISELDESANQLKNTQGWNRIVQDTTVQEQKLDQLKDLSKALIDTENLTGDQLARAILASQKGAEEAYERGNKGVGELMDKRVGIFKERLMEQVDTMDGDELAVAITSLSKAAKVAFLDGNEEMSVELDNLTDSLEEKYYALAPGERVNKAVEQSVDDNVETTAEEIDRLIREGIIEPFEDGTEEAATDVAEATEVNIGRGLMDGVNALEGGSRNLMGAFAGLGNEASRALRDAVRGNAPLSEAFANLPEEMRAALEPMVPLVKEQLRRTRKEAKHEAALMGGSIRDGIESSKDAVKSAMQDLKWQMTHPFANVKQIAKTESALTGKELANGLKSSNPDTRRQAQNTRAILIEEWEKTSGETWDHAKTIGENIGKGIKSRRRQAKRAAKDVTRPVKTELRTTAEQATTDGTNTTYNYAAGIADPEAIAAVDMSVDAATKPVGRRMRIKSPAEEGVLSTLGGPEGWGARLIQSFRKGMDAESGRHSIGESLGMSSLRPMRDFVGGSPLAGGEGQGGGGPNIRLETYGLPMRASTPLEVTQQLRRAARSGAIAPKRPAKWAKAGG